MELRKKVTFSNGKARTVGCTMKELGAIGPSPTSCGPELLKHYLLHVYCAVIAGHSSPIQHPAGRRTVEHRANNRSRQQCLCLLSNLGDAEMWEEVLGGQSLSSRTIVLAQNCCRDSQQCAVSLRYEHSSKRLPDERIEHCFGRYTQSRQ